MGAGRGVGGGRQDDRDVTAIGPASRRDNSGQHRIDHGLRTSRRAGGNAPFLLAAGVAALLLLAACGVPGAEQDALPKLDVVVDPAQTSPLPAEGAIDGEPDAAPAEPSYPPLDLSFLGANASSSELPSAIPSNLEVGFTEEGYPYRGSADAAVTIVEFSDYACPFCGRYTAQDAPQLLEQYGATGDVRFVFREFPLVGLHPTAPVAHTAAHCAGEQGPEAYWEMHDAIFAGQADWTSLPDPTEYFTDLAVGLALDMDAFGECVASGRADEVIAAGVAEAQSLGFNGTPSFQLFADGVEGTYNIIGAQALTFFQTYLDALLRGEAPSDPEPEPGEEPEPPELPLWADVEIGLRPDPDRPGLNLAGDHYKGNPDASVVVIEFSDFECPFCREHSLEVQPVLDEEFVASGEILWVFKHLPLSIHPHAPAAATAAECASDQGMFWEMHHLLFETVDRWAVDGATDSELVAIAGELGLDADQFATCFNSREALERVLADLDDARGLVNQTPSFVTVIGDRGTLTEGSRPAEQFVALLRARLDSLSDDAGDASDEE